MIMSASPRIRCTLQHSFHNVKRISAALLAYRLL